MGPRLAFSFSASFDAIARYCLKLQQLCTKTLLSSGPTPYEALLTLLPGSWPALLDES